jgi:hypothetical protein
MYCYLPTANEFTSDTHDRMPVILGRRLRALAAEEQVPTSPKRTEGTCDRFTSTLSRWPLVGGWACGTDRRGGANLRSALFGEPGSENPCVGARVNPACWDRCKTPTTSSNVNEQGWSLLVRVS